MKVKKYRGNSLFFVIAIVISSFLLKSESCDKRPCPKNCCEECYAHGRVLMEPCPALGLFQPMPPFYYNPPNDPGLCRLEVNSPSIFGIKNDDGTVSPLYYDKQVYSNFPSIDSKNPFYQGPLSGALTDPGTTGWNGIFNNNIKVDCCEAQISFIAKFCSTNPIFGMLEFRTGTKVLTSSDCDKNFGDIYLKPYVGTTQFDCN